MRKIIAAVMAALAGLGLAGCETGGGPTPSPTPWTTPSPVVSPSPTLTTEEQASIDAVNNYVAVWTDVAQHLGDGNWDRIRDVAVDPTANGELLIWNEWYRLGWHMEGGPVFELGHVEKSMTDGIGTRYRVYGCFDITNSRLVDQTGNEVGDRGADRRPTQYLVLHRANDGKYFVAENTLQEGTC